MASRASLKGLGLTIFMSGVALPCWKVPAREVRLCLHLLHHLEVAHRPIIYLGWSFPAA